MASNEVKKSGQGELLALWAAATPYCLFSHLLGTVLSMEYYRLTFPRLFQRIPSALMVLFCLLATACNSQPPAPTTIQGRIYYRKQPVLGGGTIVFTPDHNRGYTGHLGAGEIHSDGTFSVLPQPGKPSMQSGWYIVTLMTNNQALPGKYSDPAKSGLSREIRSGGPNQLDIFLE